VPVFACNYEVDSTANTLPCYHEMRFLHGFSAESCRILDTNRTLTQNFPVASTHPATSRARKNLQDEMNGAVSLFGDNNSWLFLACQNRHMGGKCIHATLKNYTWT